ncbi:MAG TPA: flagellar hook basal-body protein [Acetobacteraceae bacterium]|nr:flagellar hook basal-body protein [Acetobacteraceae bacterium]
MELSTYIATSRLVAQSHAMDVIANNIANADTPGFKAGRMLFSDWLSRQTGARTPAGGQTLAYTQDRATWLDMRPGTLQQTGNPLDLALGGNGFFTVQTGNGLRLTRAGRFGLLPDGTVADSAGNPLLDTAGRPIQIDTTTDTGLAIASDGTISSRAGVVGRIAVVRPQDPMRLKAEGSQLFAANTPILAVSTPRIVQGALEESNIQPVKELTRMMNDSQQFQFVVQFVQAEDTRRQSAIDKIAQPAA